MVKAQAAKTIAAMRIFCRHSKFLCGKLIAQKVHIHEEYKNPQPKMLNVVILFIISCIHGLTKVLLLGSLSVNR
jgi:hypothetical protein